MLSAQQNLVERFRESLVSENKQPATVESYSRDAEDFLKYLEIHRIAPNSAPPESLLWYKEHLQQIQADADNSVRRKIIGVRQFYRFLATLEFVSDSPFDEMPIPERDETLEETITESEFATILACIDGGHLKKSRDLAILNLLSREGLKANELISLRWTDLVPSRSEKFQLFVPGDKARTIDLAKESGKFLSTYKDAFTAWKSGLSEEQKTSFTFLFLSFKGKDSQVVQNKMTRHGLKFMLSELGEKSKVRHLHSESLRHLAIKRLIDEGKRPEDIMKHLGLKQLGNIAKHLARFRTSDVK